jgi:hypothetical protein
MLLGSTSVKAVRRPLMKLRPGVGQNEIILLSGMFKNEINQKTFETFTSEHQNDDKFLI